MKTNTIKFDDDLRFVFDVQGYLHLPAALTPEEVREYSRWMDEVENTDMAALNASDDKAPEDAMQHQLKRPVSRVLDADPRFACFLDHSAVHDILCNTLGENCKHIDNDLFYTYPGYPSGGWHRGVPNHPTGYGVDGKFACPMVKVFYCMTDVGPNEGAFAVVPGSHRAAFEIDIKRIDLPAQRVFDDVKSGDVIVFNEALLHNGHPNPSQKTRKTIIMNLGREDAGAWRGYAPMAKTIEAVTPRQRDILCNSAPEWVRLI